MDWDSIRRQWKTQPACADLACVSTGELHARSEKLQRTVRRRDRIEMWVAVVVAVFFAVVAVQAATDREWLRLAFALLIVAWAVFVPLRLRGARRQMPEQRPDLPLRAFLACQRDAALVQARLLGQAWRWYVAPGMAGVLGLTLSTTGPTRSTMVYCAVVVISGVLIAWLNRRSATRVFGVHARDLQRQIDILDEAAGELAADVHPDDPGREQP